MTDENSSTQQTKANSSWYLSSSPNVIKRAICHPLRRRCCHLGYYYTFFAVGYLQHNSLYNAEDNNSCDNHRDTFCHCPAFDNWRIVHASSHHYSNCYNYRDDNISVVNWYVTFDYLLRTDSLEEQSPRHNLIIGTEWWMSNLYLSQASNESNTCSIRSEFYNGSPSVWLHSVP